MTRLSRLEVPVTIFNRTIAKAEQIAAVLPGVRVAGSLLDCVCASRNVLVACSPAHSAVASVCEQMRSAARDRHIIFIVDSGLREARIMEEVLFNQGKAASVTNTAMFGWAFAPIFQKRDYSTFGGSHQLFKDIQDLLVETCTTLGVDHRLAELMSAYHDRAMGEPALAAKSFHSVHEVICGPHNVEEHV